MHAKCKMAFACGHQQGKVEPSTFDLLSLYMLLLLQRKREMLKLKFLVGLLMILGAILVVPSKQQVMTQQCQGDIQGLIRECAQYVQRSGPNARPSMGCYNIIKKVDVPCACKHLTKQVEQIISMQKVAYVLKTCGRPLSRGAKCGGYTTPPA